MKTLYKLLSVLILLALMLSACSSPTPEPTAPAEQAQPAGVDAPTEISGKVTIWYDSGAAWNGFIAQFNSVIADKYPDLEVEWVTQDAAQLSAKLVAAFSADQAPDIAMGSQTRLVASELEFDAWEDLSDELSSDPELQEIVAALPTVHVDSYKRGDKLWGLPQVVQSVGLFVRQSWLDNLGAQPPEDWAELTALAERFTYEDPDGNGEDDTFGYCIFGAPGTTNSSGVQFLYTGAAADLLYPVIDQDGKPSFNSDKAKEVAGWIYNWAHEAKVLPPDTPTFTHKEFYALVQAGKCGMGRVGAWNVGSWATSEIGEDYVVIQYPPMVKGEHNYQVSWSNAIAMNANSKNKEATYAIMKDLMSKWGQTAFYTKLTSAARTDLDWANLASKPQLLYFTEPQDFALELAYMDTWAPVLDVLSFQLNSMIADPSVDPDQAIDTAYEEAMKKYTEIRGE